MDRHTATELAYKNGYAAGLKAAEEKIVHCKDCARSGVDGGYIVCCACSPEFVSEEGFCAWGKRRSE